ncbi:MAG: hypothetical protein IJ671_00145 [Succinivibrio sp.]|nr:hypothetical protein [Succinivibrio sp.]
MVIQILIISSLGSGIHLEVVLLKYKKHRKEYCYIFFSAFHRFREEPYLFTLSNHSRNVTVMFDGKDSRSIIIPGSNPQILSIEKIIKANTAVIKVNINHPMTDITIK